MKEITFMWENRAAGNFLLAFLIADLRLIRQTVAMFINRLTVKPVTILLSTANSGYLKYPSPAGMLDPVITAQLLYPQPPPQVWPALQADSGLTCNLLSCRQCKPEISLQEQNRNQRCIK